jgi:hypothetical protein
MNLLSSHEIADLVAAQFPGTEYFEVSSIKKSEVTNIWRVELDGIDRWVVKQFRTDGHIYEHYRAELFCLQGIKESDLVPQIGFKDDTNGILCTEHLGSSEASNSSTDFGAICRDIRYSVSASSGVGHKGLPGIMSWYVSKPSGLNFLQQALIDRIWESKLLSNAAQHSMDIWHEEDFIHGDLKYEHVFKRDFGYAFCDWEYGQMGPREWDVAGLIQSEILACLVRDEVINYHSLFDPNFSSLRDLDVDFLINLASLRLAQTAIEFLSDSPILPTISVRLLITAEELLQMGLRARNA